MELCFQDTYDGREQDYVSAILVSLSMMADCYNRSLGSNGVNRLNYLQEMKFHHEMAVKTTLRLLGCAAHNVTMASTENIGLIMEHGHQGMQKVLNKYKADFALEESL